MWLEENEMGENNRDSDRWGSLIMRDLGATVMTLAFAPNKIHHWRF